MTQMMTVTVQTEVPLLRHWRREAHLSLEELEERMTEMLGQRVASAATLRNYERSKFPAAGPNPTILAAWAVACGQQIADLPDAIQPQVQLLQSLLRNAWPMSSPLAAS